MFVIIEVTRKSADLITYHLPVTSKRVRLLCLQAAICAAARHSTQCCRCPCHHKTRELFGERRGSRGFVVQQLHNAVFQCGAPKAFGAYHMLVRSTHLIFLMPLWVGIAHNPPVCPQKQPYLWMKGRKSRVPPQKQPYLWID